MLNSILPTKLVLKQTADSIIQNTKRGRSRNVLEKLDKQVSQGSLGANRNHK